MQPRALSPPERWYVASGRGGSTRGRNVMEITNYEVNCDQWRVSHISRVYPTDMSFKMCIVCILFLLAVHRLVLIVNSWDVFGGNRRGGRLSPILLKHCFCSGLMNPSVCFYLYFPSVGGAERGVFSAKLKDMRSWGLWQREKITFPLEEKKIKKDQWLFCVFVYLLIFLDVLQCKYLLPVSLWSHACLQH